jgi:phage shock protein A
MSMDENDQAVRVLVEQLGRFQDRITARIERVEEALKSHTELEAERVAGLRQELKTLRESVGDHELRIRATTDGVTQFKTWTGLASGGSSVLAVISFVKAFFGL